MSKSKVLKSMKNFVKHWARVTGISAKKFKKVDLADFPGDDFEEAWVNSLAFVFMCHAEEYGADRDDAIAAANECYHNPMGKTPMMRYMSMIDQVKLRDVGSRTLADVGARNFALALNVRIEYWNNIFITAVRTMDDVEAVRYAGDPVLQMEADEVACGLCLLAAMDARCGHAPEPEAMHNAMSALTAGCYEEVVGDVELNLQMKDALGRQQMLYGM